MAIGRVPTTANSPLTAKGDLFSYSTAPARLAVGNDGEQIVADSSTSTGLRYQEPKTLNSLINGGMDIWQRGTSFSSGGGLSVYAADRWHFYRGSNASGATFSRQTSALTGFQYAARLQRNSGNTSTESIGLRYTLESADSYRLAGKTVTLSFYLRKGADYSGTTFRATIASGTGTDQPVYAFTGFTYAVDTSVTPTTSWVRYSITGTIPSNATEVGLEMFSNASGTAGTNDYVDITGLQLEIGSVPTPFVRSAGTIQGELAACQRYYYEMAYSGAEPYGAGTANSTTNAIILTALPVFMRTVPTAVYTGTFRIEGGASKTGIAAASLSLNQAQNQQVLTAVTSSSLTTGWGFVMLANGSSAIKLSAEL